MGLKKGVNNWSLGRLAVLMSLPLLILSFSQYRNEKAWDPNLPLTWDDYQKPEKGTQDERAVSHTFCGERWGFKRIDSNSYNFKFAVKCVMVKNLSWVHPDYKSPYLLRHEQLHFDIAEYFARQLLLAFERTTYTSNFQNEMKDVRHRVAVQRNYVQELYDKQTQHSENRKMQAVWELYVKNLLDSGEVIDSALAKLPGKRK